MRVLDRLDDLHRVAFPQLRVVLCHVHQNSLLPATLPLRLVLDTSLLIDGFGDTIVLGLVDHHLGLMEDDIPLVEEPGVLGEAFRLRDAELHLVVLDDVIDLLFRPRRVASVRLLPLLTRRD